MLPRWDALPGDAERCVATIDAWASTLVESGVVEAFGGFQLSGLAPADVLDVLDSFAAANWDFRAGRERNLASVPEFTVVQLTAIDVATKTLGLDGTPPPQRPHYDAVVMTGGMVRAGIVKPRYLRELEVAGLDWDEGVFLGGFRSFAGDEVDLAPRLGVDGDNEFDAMLAGMRQAFGLAGEPTSERSGHDEARDGDVAVDSAVGAHPSSWREVAWAANGRTLRVIAAPSSEPSVRRANTADTYRFWARLAKGVRSVLVVTTPVYVPYQGAAAIEILGLEFGLSVETVAVSETASDLGADTQLFLPHHRLQELRSAIHGMRSLRRRLVALD